MAPVLAELEVAWAVPDTKVLVATLESWRREAEAAGLATVAVLAEMEVARRIVLVVFGWRTWRHTQTWRRTTAHA